ncbi:MAG: hypothetical protein LOX97_07145 [Sphingomonas sp.]|nr:hypothetical protein [Sphingomonas sp.]
MAAKIDPLDRSAFIHRADAISNVTMSVTFEFIPGSPSMTPAALSYYRKAVETG